MLNHSQLISVMADLAKTYHKEFPRSVPIERLRPKPRRIYAMYESWDDAMFDDKAVFGTGIEELDDATCYFHDGNLIVAASDSADTNTAFVNLILTDAVTRTDERIYVFTCENSIELCIRRLLFDIAELSEDETRQSGLTDGEWDVLCQAYTVLARSNLGFINCTDLSTEYIRRDWNDVSLIVIDGLERMLPGHPDAPPAWHPIDELSFELKQLAKELNIPMVFTVKLPRKCQRPSLWELRDVVTEAECDLVYLIGRNENGSRRVFLEKNRYGRLVSADI